MQETNEMKAQAREKDEEEVENISPMCVCVRIYVQVYQHIISQ